MICSAPTPHCEGEVRLYRLLHRFNVRRLLCQGCLKATSEGVFGLQWVEVPPEPTSLPAWRRRSLARDESGRMFVA